MPTYSFIRETAEDRFYERGDSAPVRGPQFVPCPVCGVEQDDEFMLAAHLGDAHPLTAPRLLIDGETVVGERLLYRQLNEARLTVSNATSLIVRENGGPPLAWSLAALRDALAESERTVLDLELTNERAGDGATATERVRVRLDVPSAGELDEVDRLFESQLAVDELDQHAADRFADSVTDLRAAARYAGALHEYAIGVLVKDGAPGTSQALEPDVHRDKFHRALEVLRQFADRPVARAVTGFARFNLNDFRSAALPSGVSGLDSCTSRLRELAGRSSLGGEPTVEDPEGHCPADRGSASILDLWVGAGHRPADATGEMLELSSAHSCSPADAVKLRALALSVGGHLLEADQVRSLARSLANDLAFGPWALDMLDDRGR